MTHITIHYTPTDPCAETPRGVLADFGGEWSVVEVGSEHRGLRLEEVVLVHHAVPDGALVGDAPVPLRGGVADNLVFGLVGQQLAEEPHLFAAVDDVLEKAVVTAGVWGVLRDEHAEDVGGNALGTHGLLLVVVHDLVVVGVVAAEVHVNAHAKEVVIVENRRVEARYKQIDGRDGQGRVEVVHARKALTEFGLHPTDVGKTLLGEAVGLHETHSGVGEETGQFGTEIGSVGAADAKDSLYEKRHKLLIISVQTADILRDAVGAYAEEGTVEANDWHRDRLKVAGEVVLPAVTAREGAA